MLTPAELDRQRITHAKLTMILSREPWSLPDPSRKLPSPRVSELLKTMSQRAATAELGISRRQLTKMIEAEAQTVVDDNPFIEDEFVPLSRVSAINLIAEKACRPQGAKWADYEGIIESLYGYTDDRKLASTEQQRKDLRKAVKKKHSTALFIPDWMDADRAVTQRNAVLKKAIDLTDHFSESLVQLLEEFPGSNPKALQDQLLNLIDYRKPVTCTNWGGVYANSAAELLSRVGDAGSVTFGCEAPLLDPVLDSICV